MEKDKKFRQVSYGLRCEDCSGLDEEMAITWVPEMEYAYHLETLEENSFSPLQ